MKRYTYQIGCQLDGVPLSLDVLADSVEEALYEASAMEPSAHGFCIVDQQPWDPLGGDAIED